MKHQSNEIERKQNFIARAIGVVAGVSGGIIAAVKIRNWSLLDFVRRGRLPESADTYVQAAEAIVRTKSAALIGTHEKTFADTVASLTEKLTKDEAAAGAIPIAEKSARELKNAGNNFRYWKQIAHEKLDKVINSEIVKEAQFGLRHSKHKTQIFVFGAVSAVAIGAAAYSVSKWLFQKRDEHSHQLALQDKREASVQGGRIGM